MKLIILFSLILQVQTEFSKPSENLITEIINVLETENLINSDKYYIQNHTDGLVVFNVDLAFYSLDSNFKNEYYGKEESENWSETDFKLEIPNHYKKSIKDKRKRIRISSVRHDEIGEFVSVIVQTSETENINILIKILANGKIKNVRQSKTIE